MNRVSNISKVLLIILLLLICIYAFCFLQNKTIAYLILSLSMTVLIIFMIYLIFGKNIKNKRNEKITQQTCKVTARILAVKTDSPGIIILQLLISLPTKDYVTSLIISKSSENQEIHYRAGQEINVFINPKNPNDIILPDTRKEITEQKKLVWKNILMGTLSLFPIVLLVVGMPVWLIYFNKPDKKFQDIFYIQLNNKQENIWELQFQPPKKLFIKIYDPVSKKKIKTIEDEKDKKMDHYMDFFFSRQEQKVFIIGKGDSPVIDIYDAVTFEKLSDIKKFEQSNVILDKGIASVQYENPYFNRLNKDDVIEITTNDGNKYFYNIPNNKFYYSENELDEYIQETNYNQMSRQMYSFVLSDIPNNVYQHQLYIIETTSKKGIPSLVELAGANTIVVDNFNESRDHYYKYCTLMPLSDGNYFLEGKIIYLEAAFAVILHVAAVNADAEEMISGIDKSGKTLFTIKQSDYPDIKEMTDRHYHPRQHDELKTIRTNDKIVFLFANYGALCVDITTGNILWKYEP